MSAESDALSRALGAKGAMGRRKVTRLLNSLAAGFLDEEKYPASSKPSSKSEDKKRAFFKSVGYAFFDARLQLAGERGVDDDDEDDNDEARDRSGVHECKEGDSETPYYTEAELERLLARSARAREAAFGLTQFKGIQRRIRHELKRLVDTTFLTTVEQYLLEFKFDELSPGGLGAQDAFRVWQASELGVDVTALPAQARPLFIEFFDAYHRMLAHGVCQFHHLVSKSCDLGERRVMLIRRSTLSSASAASAQAGTTFSAHTLVKFLADVKQVRAEQCARVRARTPGGKYASFARRFGEFDNDDDDELDDDEEDANADADDRCLEAGSPARIRPAAIAARTARLRLAASGGNGGGIGRAMHGIDEEEVAADREFDEAFSERFSVERGGVGGRSVAALERVKNKKSSGARR